MNAQTKRWVELVATLLVVVGAVNWGLVGLGWLVGGGANWNVVNMVLGPLGTMVEAVVYVLVGLAGLWLLYDWWMGMSKK
jgi:uncharacterized protein